MAKADQWQHEAQNITGGRSLTYTEGFGGDGLKKGTTVNLLQSPGVGPWQKFTCLNSLRDVEPAAKLVVCDGGLDEFVTSEETGIPETSGGQS
jgi:hypothetical protein